MSRKYLGESHKKYSEACQKEVAEMSKHPLSHEDIDIAEKSKEDAMKKIEAA